MPDLTIVAATLQALFTDEATALARQAGLVRRRSKLTGPLLLVICVVGFIQHPTATYNLLAQVAADCGLALTPQALQQRLTPAAVLFFRTLFTRSLDQLRPHARLPLALLTQFTAVYLLDSTQIGLPAALASLYPGTGGDGPPALLKWQFVWEFLTGAWHTVAAQTVAQADQTFQEFRTRLLAGSLILFDLGYVSVLRLASLAQEQVFFLCRWNPCWGGYTPDGARLELEHLLATTRADWLDQPVRLGRGRGAIEVRLVGCRLPAASREQRRARARRTAARRGWVYSARYEELLGWNLYVTNVPASRLTGEQVSLLYRVRWQVELQFKLWKMAAALDEGRGKKSGRVLCEIYAKLLGLVVFNYLSAPVRLEGEELSAGKAWQVWQRQIGRLGQAWRGAAEGAGVLAGLYALWARFGRKQSREARPSTLGWLATAGPPGGAGRGWGAAAPGAGRADQGPLGRAA